MARAKSNFLRKLSTAKKRKRDGRLLRNRLSMRDSAGYIPRSHFPGGMEGFDFHRPGVCKVLKELRDERLA